ncbi:MAG: hypothetical protein B7Z62_09370 [Deltaproteobacteria bacterium 37-65-8]|nr:MAG: hypothetical protein B7Z62_09370 [Deltaproteobacteria bacterium 37-65-8]
MSSSGRAGDRRVMADINVTPLVDVMLVLLIIFMVTAPMLTQGVDVNLPQASAKALRSDEERLIITVDANSRVFVGKQPVEFNRLGGVLREIVARRTVKALKGRRARRSSRRSPRRRCGPCLPSRRRPT